MSWVIGASLNLIHRDNVMHFDRVMLLHRAPNSMRDETGFQVSLLHHFSQHKDLQFLGVNTLLLLSVWSHVVQHNTFKVSYTDSLCETGKPFLAIITWIAYFVPQLQQ